MDLINLKKHLTLEGLQQIINIKASMNLGLPEKLNKAWPSSIKVERPKAELLKRLDPNWLAGFIAW